MTTTAHPRLLAPIEIRGCVVPNRVVMGSMHLNLEGEANAFDRMRAFYAERARGGTGLIITGGFSPSEEGMVGAGCLFASESDVGRHRTITDAVHAHGGRILLQLLHGGPMARVANPVAASAVRSPLNPHIVPKEMTEAEIEMLVERFACSAKLALDAGYDGVEVHASEGFLLSCFLTPATNERDDEWGGEIEERMRFPVDVARAVRAALGPKGILSVRISLLDLVEDGGSWPDVVAFARALEDAGVDLLNSNFAWLESPIPSSPHFVPRGAFTWASRRLKGQVRIPIVASHRINTPELAEQLLASGAADMVSMARSLLADPELVLKSREARTGEINTCVACNQACIDRMIDGTKTVSCMVNPRACHETEILVTPAARKKRIAVVGGGVAGLSFAAIAAERGHSVCVFEASAQIGGLLKLARAIPGKSEFGETIRYYEARLPKLGVELRLGCTANAAMMRDGGFDEVVVATGVRPRLPALAGLDLPHVTTYADLLSGKTRAGERVVVLGAGPIGVDVAMFLLVNGDPTVTRFCEEWGIDTSFRLSGGMLESKLASTSLDRAGGAEKRQVTLMQRSATDPFARLGKSVGWVSRTMLRRRGVQILRSVRYERIVENGVEITGGEGAPGTKRIVPADTVVICAGQESENALAAELRAGGMTVHVVGGAAKAAEIDAFRATDEGVRLGARL